MRGLTTITAIHMIMMMMMISTAAASDLTGRATVVDGDTIRIGATSVRIWGLAATKQDACRSCPNDSGAAAGGRAMQGKRDDERAAPPDHPRRLQQG